MRSTLALPSLRLASFMLLALAACSEGQLTAAELDPDGSTSDDLVAVADGAPTFDLPVDAPDMLDPDATSDSLDASSVDIMVVDDAASFDTTPPPFDAAPPDDTTSVTCPPGRVACGTLCSDLVTDPVNCGRCGVVCALGQDCFAGVCGPRCDAPRTRCSGVCTDTSSDPSNCGACARECGVTDRCVAGACQIVCPASRVACAGVCVDVASDSANCGACGHACTTGFQCRAGACVPTGVGAPCAHNADCMAGAPTCFPDATGWSSGYCTRQCVRETDCPTGSTCVTDGSVNFCLRVCHAVSDCRGGYLCRSVGTLSACYPSCAPNPLALCGAARCDSGTGLCHFVCASNADCIAGSSCGTTTSPRRCQCTASTDCGPGRICLTRYGFCGCAADSACGPDAICDFTFGVCRPLP